MRQKRSTNYTNQLNLKLKFIGHRIEVIEQAVSQAGVAAGVDRKTAAEGIVDFIAAPQRIKLPQQTNAVARNSKLID